MGFMVIPLDYGTHLQVAVILLELTF